MPIKTFLWSREGRLSCCTHRWVFLAAIWMIVKNLGCQIRSLSTRGHGKSKRSYSATIDTCCIWELPRFEIHNFLIAMFTIHIVKPLIKWLEFNSIKFSNFSYESWINPIVWRIWLINRIIANYIRIVREGWRYFIPKSCELILNSFLIFIEIIKCRDELRSLEISNKWIFIAVFD